MTPEERFMQHVSIEDGCWIWTGRYVKSTTGGGRSPRFSIGPTSISARRFIYEAEFLTTIPASSYALATCGDTRCVNPDHIEVGIAPRSKVAS